MFAAPVELQETDTPDVWAVVAPLVWQADGVRVVVPVGFLTDLASVPAALRVFPILDVDGRSRSPAVLHDWLYTTHQFSKEASDTLLCDALLSRGVGPIATRTFWVGVHFGGQAAYDATPAGPTLADFTTPAAFAAWQAGT